MTTRSFKKNDARAFARADAGSRSRVIEIQ